MANLFSDNFNRADSDSLGASWTERLGDWDIVSNAMKSMTGVDTNECAHTAAYATADYTVQVVITPGATTQHRGPCGRRVNFSAADSDCYTVLLTSAGADLDLYKRVSGTWTKLGDGTFAYAVGTPATIKLEMNGTTGTNLKGYANGVEKISGSDSALSAAGDAGCIHGGDANDIWDDFTVDDLAGAGPAATGFSYVQDERTPMRGIQRGLLTGRSH